MNRHPFFNRAAGAIVLLMLWSAAPVNAQGLLYTVNSTGDGGNVASDSICDDGTGHCTLRAALEAANAHPGTDGIRFSIPVSDPGYNGLFWTINLTRALPDVSESIGIIGPGANLLTVRRGAGGEYRIFNVTTTGTVTFSRLTINNGLAGGGDDDGGGFQNLRGTVNVTNCTLSENRASLYGGGIYNAADGTVNVTNCTLSGNRAVNGAASGAGGGIFNLGILTVVGSTISVNSADVGGGLYNIGTGNLTNSTISGNSGAPFGGFYNASGGVAVVKSSIIALNINWDGFEDAAGQFASGGFNMIGSAKLQEFTSATDQRGTVSSPLNPKLDSNGLQDNGGPTKTIALRSDSPAIDAGTSVGLSGPLATDQRGAAFPRTIDFPSVTNPAGGDGTDIGAFEFPMLKMDSVVKLPNGHILLRGVGIPNRQHTIQASRNLGPNSFISIGTPTADGTGALQYDDAAALDLEKRFYRLTFP